MGCSCYKKIMPQMASNYFDFEISLRYVIILILILLVFGKRNARPVNIKRKRQEEEDIFTKNEEEITSGIVPYLYLVILFNILNKDKGKEKMETHSVKMDYHDNKYHSRKSNNYHGISNIEDYKKPQHLTVPGTAKTEDLEKEFETHEFEGESRNYTNNIAEFSEDFSLVHDQNDASVGTEDSSFEDNENKAPLAELIKNDYRGAMISAILPNGVIATGEVAFNFDHIIALKYGNSTIFINENRIISFH